MIVGGKKCLEAHFSPFLGSSVFVISDLFRINAPFQQPKSIFQSSEMWLTSVSLNQGEKKIK